MYPESRDGDYLGERSLDLYLREINNTALLTREQERKLARRIRKGEEEALHALVKANLRFVVSIASAWVITVPASALLAALIYSGLQLL